MLFRLQSGRYPGYLEVVWNLVVWTRTDHLLWPQSWGRRNTTTELDCRGPWCLASCHLTTSQTTQVPFCICGLLSLWFWLFNSAIVWTIVCEDVWLWSPSLCLWQMIPHFLWALHSTVFESWWQNSPSFLGHWFCMALVLSKWDALSPTYQPILQLSIYLNPFPNKK